MSGLFVTGTDTGVGKTVVAGALAAFLLRSGRSAVTQKWVETGAESGAGDLRMHLDLCGDSGVSPEMLGLRRPYAFRTPASPHFAASIDGALIDPAVIRNAYEALSARFDWVIVEGAGGLLVPLTRGLLLADLVAALGLRAIVVVANRLGAINHALLTVEALRARRVALVGLVFNRTSAGGDERILRDNVSTVADLSGVPVLGEMPHVADMASVHSVFQPIGGAILARVEEMRGDE